MDYCNKCCHECNPNLDKYYWFERIYFCLPVCHSAYLYADLPTYLCISLPIYNLPAYLLTSLPTYLFIYVPICLQPTCLLSNRLTRSLPPSLLLYLQTYRPTNYLPPYLRSYLFPEKTQTNWTRRPKWIRNFILLSLASVLIITKHSAATASSQQTRKLQYDSNYRSAITFQVKRSVNWW